jgi:hypothetical protein
MMPMPLQYQQSDRRTMTTYICERIGGKPTTLLLADGPDGPVFVRLDPYWDDYDQEWGLLLETDCPGPRHTPSDGPPPAPVDDPPIDITDVYEHLRRREMTWAEWHRERQGQSDRRRVEDLEAELAALRLAATAAKEAIDRVVNPDVAVVEPTEVEDPETCEHAEYRFQRLRDVWVVRFLAEVEVLPDWDGYGYIAELLAHPEKCIECIELQGLQDSTVAHLSMKPQLALPSAERRMLEKRIADLEQEIARAADPAEKVELQEEYDRASAMLKDAKYRRLGPPSAKEKSRKAVCNAITRAKKRITVRMPEFAKFLDRFIVPADTAYMYSPCAPAPQWLLMSVDDQVR